MQWTDSSSLVLWCSLITAEIPGLMIVCAYRDNEVPAGHPFDVAVKDVSASGIQIEAMQLRPIQAPAIVSILSAAIKYVDRWTASLLLLACFVLAESVLQQVFFSANLTAGSHPRMRRPWLSFYSKRRSVIPSSLIATSRPCMRRTCCALTGAQVSGLMT